MKIDPCIKVLGDRQHMIAVKLRLLRCGMAAGRVGDQPPPSGSVQMPNFTSLPVEMSPTLGHSRAWTNVFLDNSC